MILDIFAGRCSENKQWIEIIAENLTYVVYKLRYITQETIIKQGVIYMETIKEISQYELERGKPMPSRNHGAVQTALIIALHKFGNKFNTFSELSLKLEDFEATPDTCVYPKSPINWLHDEDKMTEPPLLAVEIMSPAQGIQSMINKIEQYFKHGVRSCWLVQPTIQTITVFTPEMRSKTYSSGIIKDHATDIEISMEELFSFSNGAF